MPTKDALKMAHDAGLDLIKIAPGANPPVCKIADYGKYQYEQIRKEKEARKKQHQIEIKEILPTSIPMMLIPRSMQPESSSLRETR